jgi:hypothetical protein
VNQRQPNRNCNHYFRRTILSKAILLPIEHNNIDSTSISLEPHPTLLILLFMIHRFTTTPPHDLPSSSFNNRFFQNIEANPTEERNDSITKQL